MRLLLTVTAPVEVATALEGGADLVDVKDPRRGSLGAPDPAVLDRVARRLDGRVPLSVPLGDGPHEPAVTERRARAAAESGAAYVKVGLATRGPTSGSSPRSGGPPGSPAAVLEAARRGLQASGADATLVAVGFVDAPPGPGPRPGEIPEVAARAGAGAAMLDTLGKTGPGAPAALGRRRLGRWIRGARRRGLETGLAGGLDARSIRALAGLPVDVVGVRGGACSGGRAGRLDPARCRALRRAVDAADRGTPEGVGGGPVTRPAADGGAARRAGGPGW